MSLQASHRLLRYLSTALMLYIGVYFALSVLGNFTEYHYSWNAVHDLLSMDNLARPAGAQWRSIQSPVLQTLALWVIIFAETVISCLSIWGSFKLWFARKKNVEDFDNAKIIAFLALGLGITLFLLGYLCIGCEWFRAWLSVGYSPQTLSFQLLTLLLLVFLLIKSAK